MPGEGEIYMPDNQEKRPAMHALEQELRKTMVDSQTLHERMRVQMGNPETTIEQVIKTRRVDVDRCIKDVQKLAADINRGPGGRNVALAITHLEDAKMRLGMALGELGHKLPEEFRDEAP